MSKYRNWGNVKSKSIQYDENHIDDKDISIFNSFSEEPQSEQIELVNNTSIILVTDNNEVGYAIVNNNDVLEANSAKTEEEVQEMIDRRDIAIGTILSSDNQIDSLEELSYREKEFAHTAETEPHYISNEYLPAGCEVMVTHDEMTNEYSASVLKNGYVVDTVSSDNFSNSQEFAEGITQAVTDSTATDARLDNDNIRAVQEQSADYYLMDIIKNDIDKMRAEELLEAEKQAAREKYAREIDAFDGDEATLKPQKHDYCIRCDDEEKKEKKDKPKELGAIEIDGDDSKYNRPAHISNTREDIEKDKNAEQNADLEEEGDFGIERSLKIYDDN